MPQNTNDRRRVLFVDDDPQFLATMERVMGEFSCGGWQIALAESASQAMVIIGGQKIDLVVIDIQMPVLDGLQFLTLLHRKHPQLQKVVLTGYATEAYRAACLSQGAELFLEKPLTKDELAHLFSTLNELMKWRPEEGFRGVLRKVGLQDVIQMECLGVGSSILEIEAGSDRGRIYIRDGSLIHAEIGETQGEEAFHTILSFKSGQFSFLPFTEPGVQSLQGQWEFLLMEAAQKRDEEAEPESLGQEDGRVEAPPAVEVTPGLGEVVQPVTEPHPPGMEEFGRAAEAERGARRKTEEILVCSPAGDVLYEWQCRNSDLWVNFFEFLSRKSQWLGQGLPTGRFERLEIEATPERIVALLRSDSAVIIRSKLEDRK